MDGNNRKFKNFFLKKDVQIRMVSSSLIYMFLAVLVMLAVVLFPIIQQMLTAEDIDLQYAAAQAFLLMSRRLVPAVGAMAVLILIHQVVLTHRVCGPLANFSSYFKRVGEGDLASKVVIRHGDYLKKECEIINQMVDSFSSHINRIKIDNEKLVTVLDEAIAHVDDLEARKKIEETLSAVKDNAEQIGRDLSIFKLPAEDAPSPDGSAG